MQTIQNGRRIVLLHEPGFLCQLPAQRLIFWQGYTRRRTGSEQDWKAFSDSVISTYFPEGYTEWDAKGRWKDTETKETISEPTKVVTFLGKVSKQRNAAIDSIAQRYLRRFQQQSVLRTDSKSKVTFINKKP